MTIRHKIIYFFIFIPALAYLSVSFRTANNYPKMDDFDAVLQWLVDFRHASFWEKFSLLLRQHNEHRILSSRIAYATYYYIFGNINFRSLIIIADLQLMVVAIISISFIRDTLMKYWEAASVIWMLLLFDLNTYEIGSIAMYGMQNFGMLMLFMLSLYFLRKGGRWIIAGASFELLCILSSANGIIGIILINILLIAKRKRDVHAVICTAVMLVAGWLYLIGYTTIQRLDQNPFSISAAFAFFIRMLGAPISLSHDGSLLFGVAMIVLMIWVFPYRRIKDECLWPLLCVLLFSIGSMASAAMIRGQSNDAQYQTSRYLMYPQLVYAVTMAFLLMKVQTAFIREVKVAIILGVCYMIWYSNYNFGKAGFERMAARAEGRQYYYPDPTRADMICKEACEDGIYCIDDER